MQILFSILFSESFRIFLKKEVFALVNRNDSSKRYIFKAYITRKDGTRIYARQYGLRASVSSSKKLEAKEGCWQFHSFIKYYERRGFMAKTYKPGEKAVTSGQYAIIGQRGGKTGVERTVVKGEPFPPTRRSGEKFILVDKTKH